MSQKPAFSQINLKVSDQKPLKTAVSSAPHLSTDHKRVQISAKNFELSKGCAQ